jgi:hypothetical protein
VVNVTLQNGVIGKTLEELEFLGAANVVGVYAERSRGTGANG